MQASSVLVVARTQSRIGDVGIVGLLNSAWNTFENRIQQKQIKGQCTVPFVRPNLREFGGTRYTYVRPSSGVLKPTLSSLIPQKMDWDDSSTFGVFSPKTQPTMRKIARKF